MGKGKKQYALYVLMTIYAPILKFWKTVHFLLTRTEEYHRNPDLLFDEEFISRKRMLKWSTFTYTAIGTSVMLSIAHPYNYTGLLLNSLIENYDLAWLEPLNVLLASAITGVLLLRLFMFGPIVLTEVVCRKIYRNRRPMRRFVYSAAPLYALVSLLESVMTFSLYLFISFILNPETVAETTRYIEAGIGIWYILTLWFVFYILPRHLAYQYRLSLYKSTLLCYFGPIICVFYAFVTPFGYLMYFFGWLLNTCITLVFPLSWPFAFRRLQKRIREGGWRCILFANREQGEPRLGPKWLAVVFILLFFIYMYYIHLQMRIPVDDNHSPVQDANCWTQ